MRHAVLERLRCPWSGGPLRLELLDGDDEQVEHAVLHSEAGEFAVVAGIPVFLPDHDDLVPLVRAGEHDRALARAAFGQIPAAGWRRVGDWLAATERLRGLGRRIEAGRRARIEARAAPLGDPDVGVEARFALAYHDLRLRNPEVYAYNWYRFGLPRHLVALAALEWAPTRGPVLDVGCGAGHLTWALQARVGPEVEVIGVDALFFALHVARTRLVPGADLICCELEALPLRDDAVGGVWMSDVFHALARKSQVAGELRRVATADAWGAAIGLAVAGHDHEYRGRPLRPDGYHRLLPEGAALVADRDLLDDYLDRRGADRSRSRPVDDAPTVTALWDPTGEARDGVPLADWPHGRGVAGPNLLLRPDGRAPGSTEVVLDLPTAAFGREHADLRRYTPERAEVPDEVVEAARAGAASPGLDRLIEEFVVLGYPEGYLTDPWAGFGPGA